MNLIKLTLATLIFVMSFAMQSNEAEAQSCPTGMTYTQVSMMIDGCEYHVGICYSCGFTHPGDVNVMDFIKIDPACNSSLDPNQVLKSINSIVSTYQFIIQNLCDWPTQPAPCGEGGTLVEVGKWACWKIQMITHLGVPTLKYSPCGDAYCLETTKYCWDGVEIIESKEFKFFGIPSCTLEVWEIAVPQNVGEVSECYIYHTPCEE